MTARQLERAEAIRHLPDIYSLALCLRDAGLTDELIAECLAVEREALDLLLMRLNVGACIALWGMISQYNHYNSIDDELRWVPRTTSCSS